MPFSVRACLEQFTLAHPGGESELKISVAAPANAPEAAVPVLYVMDGDFVFGIAAEIARVVSIVAGFPAFYVVGVGYDADYQDFLKLRTADLTPPIGAEALEKLGAVGAMIGGDRNGCADAFLAFMADTLQPEIAARYPQTSGGAQIFFGHSLGGLFAANALLTRPEAFSAYIVSSPSLWWDSFSIFDKLPAFEEGLRALAQQPRVFVDVGGREQDPPKSVPPGLGVTLEEAQAQIRGARMVDTAREFADALKQTGLAHLRHMVFEADDHTSAAPGALIHGMRFVLGREG